MNREEWRAYLLSVVYVIVALAVIVGLVAVKARGETPDPLPLLETPDPVLLVEVQQPIAAPAVVAPVRPFRRPTFVSGSRWESHNCPGCGAYCNVILGWIGSDHIHGCARCNLRWKH